MTDIGSPEFAFEVSLCAYLESTREGIISRQLGSGITRPSGRILDVVLATPGPQFEARTQLTPAAVPQPLRTADLGAGRFRPAAEVLSMAPERRRSLVEHAVDAGVLEQRWVNGRREIKLRQRYPRRWFDELIAIENKPDLTSPGDLDWQLRYDVSLGVADRVVVATETHVTRTHLNRIPDPVGVWQYTDETRTVHRQATPLRTPEPGLELLEEHSDWTEFTVVSPAAKRRRRQQLAEQAYGKGWRTYGDFACSQLQTTTRHGAATIPYCSWAETIVNPAESCGEACPGYTAGEPLSIDGASERASRTRWQAQTDRPRRQSGLDQFQNE